jgi:hypothetical protein
MNELWDISLRSGRTNGVWVEFADRDHSGFLYGLVFFNTKAMLYTDNTCATREYWDAVTAFVKKNT